MAAGCNKNGSCQECVNEMPASGSAAEMLCHAALYALLSLLYATDLIWQVDTIHCIGWLASKALVAGQPLHLKSE